MHMLGMPTQTRRRAQPVQQSPSAVITYRATRNANTSAARALGNRAFAGAQRLHARSASEFAPGSVERVLSEFGRPLSPRERSFFEPRLGYDLSPVRIHEGHRAAGAALSVGARAFAVGRHVVLGAEQYDENSQAGRLLMAHELTHTMQQGAVRGAAHSGPAQPRTQAVAVAPRLQRIRLTNGQFGKELEWYQREISIPDRPFRAIWRSASYQGMVRVLDQKYVGLHEPTLPTSYEIGNDGRLLNDPANDRWAPTGRRVMSIWTSGVMESNAFNPAQRASDRYDEMWLHDMFYWNGNVPPQNTVDQDGTFIEALAHETAHAHNLVTGSGRPSLGPNPTLAASIAASVQEESHTRGQEAQVLGEVSRRGGLRGFTPTPGSTVAREVERSFVSGEPRRTYLEMFFFQSKIRDARQQISDADATRLEAIVRDIPLTSATADRFLDRNRWIPFYDRTVDLYDFVSEDYGKWLFWQRVVDERWKAVEQMANATPADRERILQEHATAYFDSGIAYTP